MAKATCWLRSDAQTRKHGERTGLETPVVHAVNDANQALEVCAFSAEANAISWPPGDYGRKAKTQRN